MYKKTRESDQMVFEFYLPFGGKLDAGNRWILLAETLPWSYIEKRYEETLSGSDKGRPALSARMAFGALYIKEKMGFSDEELVDQIQENPYLQYFIGLKKYSYTAPFDSSEMVHFRKRFAKDILADINEEIVRCATAAEEKEDDPPESPPSAEDTQGKAPEEDGNSGKLIIDATCTPADIPYPTDLKILNEAREKTEEIIDVLHEPDKGNKDKPRTYRNKAAKAYLSIAKQRKAPQRRIRKHIGKQLRYLKRNLGHIEKYAGEGRLKLLSGRLYKLLLVSREVYRQQQHMYDHKVNRIPDRIVNLYQPHVRPIVRGKAGTPVEFGAKISVSVCNGYSTVDRLDWNNYNESEDLQMQVERFKERTGHYPASVHADKIYRSRDNRNYCKKRGIRLSGPPLGRPLKETEENREELKALKAQQRQDERDRQAVEGKFGQGKRRFSLSRIMARLKETSESVILMSFIVMNLEKVLKGLLFLSYFTEESLARTVCRALRWIRSGEFSCPELFAGLHLCLERNCRAA